MKKKKKSEKKFQKKNLKSRCHAKRRAGAATRGPLSFCMTTTQDIRDLFTRCHIFYFSKMSKDWLLVNNDKYVISMDLAAHAQPIVLPFVISSSFRTEKWIFHFWQTDKSRFGTRSMGCAWKARPMEMTYSYPAYFAVSVTMYITMLPCQLLCTLPWHLYPSVARCTWEHIPRQTTHKPAHILPTLLYLLPCYHVCYHACYYQSSCYQVHMRTHSQAEYSQTQLISCPLCDICYHVHYHATMLAICTCYHMPVTMPISLSSCC